MGDDEQVTLSTVQAYREIVAQHITAHQGRVADAPGDALLAEFPSAIEAAASAVDIQRELAGRNASLPEHRRMRLGIGVDPGDVTEQDGALYGDGVNIAARLKSLAPAGGICVSGSVYDQVEGKLPVAFKFEGEQSVKNIAKPVRAYHALLDLAQNQPTDLSGHRRKRLVAMVAVLLGIVALMAAVAWFSGGLRGPKDSAQEDLVLALPKGPAIAALPVSNLGEYAKRSVSQLHTHVSPPPQPSLPRARGKAREGGDGPVPRSRGQL